jgi:hypothetical protein
MTWLHTPAITPEVGAYALIAIACISGIGWIVHRMLNYRAPEHDPHKEPLGEASTLRRERNG